MSAPGVGAGRAPAPNTGGVTDDSIGIFTIGKDLYNEPEVFFTVFLVTAVLTVGWEMLFDYLYRVGLTRPVLDLKPHVARELVSFGLTGLCLSLMSEIRVFGSFIPYVVYRYMQFLLFVKSTLMVVIVYVLIARLQRLWWLAARHEAFRHKVLTSGFPQLQIQETLAEYWERCPEALLLARAAVTTRMHLQEHAGSDVDAIRYYERLNYRWLLDLPRFRWTHWFTAVSAVGLALSLCEIASTELREGRVESLYLFAAVNWIMVAVVLYIHIRVAAAYRRRCGNGLYVLPKNAAMNGVPAVSVVSNALVSDPLAPPPNSHATGGGFVPGGAGAAAVAEPPPPEVRLEYMPEPPGCLDASHRTASRSLMTSGGLAAMRPRNNTVFSQASRRSAAPPPPTKVPLEGPLTMRFFTKADGPQSLVALVQVLLLLQMVYLAVLLSTVVPAMLDGLYGFTLITASALPSVLLYVHLLPQLMCTFTILSTLVFEYTDDPLLEEIAVEEPARDDDDDDGYSSAGSGTRSASTSAILPGAVAAAGADARGRARDGHQSIEEPLLRMFGEEAAAFSAL